MINSYRLHAMMNVNLPTALIAVCVCVDVTLQTANRTATPLPITRLYNDFITPYNYVTRPVQDPSKVTKVQIRMNFLQLMDVDEISSAITISMWLEISWRDEIRIWDPDDYQGIDHLHVRDRDVWRPTFVAINSPDQRYLFENVESSVYVTSNGSAYWYPGQKLSFSCCLDLTRFPFDEQECLFYLLTRDLSTDVEIVDGGVIRQDNVTRVPNTEWDVSDISIGRKGAIPSGVAITNFSVSIYCFGLKRKPGFFVLSTILPVNILTLLSLVVFVIPDSSGEKISYSVTLLLATGIYLSTVTSLLPPTSDNTPAVMFYLVSLYVFGGMAMITALGTMLWRQKHVNQNKIDVTESTNDDSSSDKIIRYNMFQTNEENGLEGGRSNGDRQLEGGRSNGHKHILDDLNLEGQGLKRKDEAATYSFNQTPRVQSRIVPSGNCAKTCCPHRLDAVVIVSFVTLWVAINASYIGYIVH